MGVLFWPPDRRPQLGPLLLALLAWIAPAHAGGRYSAAIDAERVAVTRGQAIELYRRADGAPLGVLPVRTRGPQFQLWLAPDGTVTMASQGASRWKDGIYLGTRPGWPVWMDASGVTWSIGERAAYADGPDGTRATVELGALAADFSPVAPGAPAALALHRAGLGDPCMLVGRAGEGAVCFAPDLGMYEKVGQAFAVNPFLPEDRWVLVDAQARRRMGIPGDMLAAGPAGFVTVESDVTRVHNPDGRVTYTAPFPALGAGVGTDAVVLVEDAEVDRVWIVGPGGVASWALPPAPEGGPWFQALSEPTARVTGLDRVAWLARDDLHVVAAMPRYFAWPVYTPVSGGVRVSALPAPGRVSRVEARTWRIVGDNGKRSWDVEVDGSLACHLKEEGLVVFLGASGDVYGVDAFDGHQWVTLAGAMREVAAARLPIAAVAQGDRVVVTSAEGWALLDSRSGVVVSTGAGRLRDTEHLSEVFTDDAGAAWDRDGRLRAKLPLGGVAMGLLDDGAVISTEGGGLAAREGERLRWTVPLEPHARVYVIGDSVWTAAGERISRLDGPTGKVAAAIEWPNDSVLSVDWQDVVELK
jgi:hypothetical protein